MTLTVRRQAISVLVLLLLSLSVVGQTDVVNFKIQVVLIDEDLNQKPVPKFTLDLRRLDSSPSEASLNVKTGLDGLGEITLSPGRYQLSTPKPIAFHGKLYSWDMEVTIAQGMKTLELTNDNAKVTGAVVPAKSARVTDELTSSFKRFQSSVVTVWSEFGRGTGFIIDSKGLVMTNQHVIGPSDYIAVQFDEKRKVTARVLVSDSQKDVAVLWVNLEALPDATVAPLAKIGEGEPPVVEGERVFTIGSPLNQRKVMTTGIVSKVEAHAIISDININHGNSGGPLFNSLGEVVGITTFGDPDRQGGPGISGIVRIEETLPMLAQARAELIDRVKPDPALLPVEPTTPFPVEAIKESLMKEKLNPDPYIFDMGDYSIAIMTPIFKYHLILESEMRAAREKNKRNKKDTAIKETFQPLDDLKEWAEYTGEYKPVIQIRATPHLSESFWGAVGRNMAGSYGLRVPAKLRYKTDFYRMKLMCGANEVQPIQPGKIANVIDVRNPFVNATDATYEGLYTYPADAITNDCTAVTLHIYSENNPNKSTVKTLDSKTVTRVVADFEPYMSLLDTTTLTTNQSTVGPGKPTLFLQYLVTAQQHYQNGLALLKQQKWAEAEAELREAVRLKPDNPYYHFQLGSALSPQMKLSETEAEFRESVRFDPTNGLWHAKLGYILSVQKKWEEAEKEAQEAIRLDQADAGYKALLQNIQQKK